MAGRILSEKQRNDVFRILGDPKTLDARRINKLFARRRLRGVPYNTDDVITIGSNDSPFVKEGTVTTLGIYIANKFLFEDLQIFGYINKTINGKLTKKIDTEMSKALMAGDITTDQYANYIDRCQYLYGGPLALIIGTSVSEILLTLPKSAEKLRDQLLKENKEKLEANDPQTSAHIEKQIVAAALEDMEKTEDPALALFDSGCGVDPFNNYKTICVMKGAVEDNTGESPTGYKVITSNYDTGITKDDMPKIADTVVTSGFSSGVATQDSGTNGKKYNALFQNVRLADRKSDCGTTQTIRVRITEDYLYRYIVENGKLVFLDEDTLPKYLDKYANLRSGVHCKLPGSNYCSKCVGDRAYRVGVRNIGLTFMTVSGSTLNASLKKKHDISIKFYQVTMDDIMKYVR